MSERSQEVMERCIAAIRRGNEEINLADPGAISCPSGELADELRAIVALLPEPVNPDLAFSDFSASCPDFKPAPMPDIRSYHGTGEQAIEFVLMANSSAWTQETVFLAAWQEGALDEWPEFYEWLGQRDHLATPCGDEVEAVARLLSRWTGANPDTVVEAGNVVGDPIEVPAWQLEQLNARTIIAAISTIRQRSGGVDRVTGCDNKIGRHTNACYTSMHTSGNGDCIDKAALSRPAVDREALKKALRYGHRDFCYPDASDGELDIWAGNILALLAPTGNSGGESGK